MSAENGLIFMHQLRKPKLPNPKFYNQSLVLSKYKWELKVKIEIGFPIFNISYTFIGDVFLCLNNKSFTIWAKEHSKPFECILCEYCRSAPEIKTKKLDKLPAEFENENMLNSEISTGIK